MLEIYYCTDLYYFFITVDDHIDGGMSSMPPTSTLGTGHNTMMSTRSVSTTYPRPPQTLTGVRFDMPVDDEQYLIPSSSSPHSKNTPTNNNINNPYMELVPQQQAPSVFQYPPPQGLYLTDNPSNYGRVPEPGGIHGILPSMDNPEYIWNSSNSTRGDYHTLGIPLRGNSANNGSPASSQGPSSIHSVTSQNPPNSANNLPSSLASSASNGGRQSTGLNGVVNRYNTGSALGSHPISPNDLENGPHEYYNDFDRLQPPLKLQPPPKNDRPKNETTV